jgi:hypothetical protein
MTETLYACRNGQSIIKILNAGRTWCVVREGHCSKKRKYFTIQYWVVKNGRFL